LKTLQIKNKRGKVSRLFLKKGFLNFDDASEFVKRLPYGRNSKRGDYTLVIKECRGTCSTKHALLANLAEENDFKFSLWVGIYKMNPKNTPGIGKILRKYQIKYIPEAHCYLKRGNRRYDFTRTGSGSKKLNFLHEQKIKPSQVSSLKVKLHQTFLKTWLRKSVYKDRFTFEQFWEIREACIQAISE
jgi:hypothetical protein